MDHALAKPRDRRGKLFRATLVASAVIEALLAALPLYVGLAFIGYECGGTECIAESDATGIMWIGFAVSIVLFAAAGFTFAASRKERDRRRELLATLLCAVGSVGWLAWFLIYFTAGIRATT